jgi:hypothetical protein
MSLYTTSTNNVLIGWENSGSVGTLLIGETSELYVKAFASTSTFNLVYKTISGTLPNGLTLNRDGTFEGKIKYDSSNSNTTTVYNFSIAATDNHNNRLIEGEFSITSVRNTSTEYAIVYFKPLMNLNKRYIYREFITDKNIFVSELIYRPMDENFGVQRDLKMILDFGIERLTLAEYRTIINQNFYRQRLNPGEIKSAYSMFNGKPSYEIIYIDISDRYTNEKYVSIPREFTHNGVTYYPASGDNMRSRIKDFAKTTDALDPKFSKIAQSNISNRSKFGYFKFIPVCFALPGKSAVIIDKIKKSKFEFNRLDFDIDRIFIQNPLDYDGTKYLILNKSTGLQ